MASFAAGRVPSVAIGDLNGDNKPDLAVPNRAGGVAVLLNTTQYGAGETTRSRPLWLVRPTRAAEPLPRERSASHRPIGRRRARA